jgi:hypothetical protein
MWQVVTGILGIFHVRPLYAGYALGGILLVTLLVGIWGQATGRVQFTFEPTEFQKLEADKNDNGKGR